MCVTGCRWQPGGGEEFLLSTPWICPSGHLPQPVCYSLRVCYSLPPVYSMDVKIVDRHGVCGRGGGGCGDGMVGGCRVWMAYTDFCDGQPPHCGCLLLPVICPSGYLLQPVCTAKGSATACLLLPTHSTIHFAVSCSSVFFAGCTACLPAVQHFSCYCQPAGDHAACR